MREIKFRAWDKKNKGWCSYTNSDCMNNLDNPECAIMQYTGLKDKNGKEIYEGDILRMESEMHVGVAPVLWSDDHCGFIYEGWQGYFSKIVPNLGGSGIVDLETRAEIIGNIYENPELLQNNPTL